MPLFNDYETEVRTLQAWQERKDRVASIVSNVTPEAAALMSQYAHTFPTVPSGITRSLSQANIPVDNPIAKFALTQAQYRNMVERGRWDGDMGTRRPAPTPRAPTPAQSRETLPTSFYESRNRAVQDAITKAQSAGILKEGVLTEPNADSPAHAAFVSLQAAFDKANMDLPYLSASGIPTRYLGSNTAQQRREHGETEDINPQQQASGGGRFAGIGRIDTPLSNPSDSATAPIQAQHLTQMGLPVDPNNPLAFTAPVVRAGFMAMDAPIQELQGQVRNIRGAFHGEGVNWLQPQSDLGVLYTGPPKGEFGPSVAGTGYFVNPESALAQERRRREAERGQIGGHNITLGRWIADQVVEPDTKPYLIVSGLVDAAAQVADPTAFLMGETGKIGVARRAFEAEEVAGIGKGIRKYFHGPTVQRWLDNNIGLINTFAQTDDAYDIAKITNFKINPSLAHDLSVTPDTRDVRQLITNAVEGGEIRATTTLKGTLATRISQSWTDTVKQLNPDFTPRAIRLLQPMPGTTVDMSDPRQAANTLMNALHNAHAPAEDIKEVYNLVAHSQGRGDLMRAVETALEGPSSRVGGMLRSYGLENDESIAVLTSLNRTTLTQHLQGLVDDIGSDIPTWEHILENGKSEWVGGPHLPTEYIPRYVTLPDQRAIRRMTTKYKFLLARQSEEVIGKPRLPIALLDNMTSQVLKPLWLLRLAWPIRVIGEEQLRMASAGLDSAFSGHPMSWMSLAIGSSDSRMSRMLERLPGLKSSSTNTASGMLFDALDEFQKGVYNTHRSWLDKPGSIPIPHKTLYDKAVPSELQDFRRAWADEITLLHKDPVANFVANNNLNDAVDWLWSGEGRKHLDELVQTHPGTVSLSSKTDAARYIQTVSDRIGWMTNGDTDLLDIIKTGEFTRGGNTLPIMRGGTNQRHPDLTRHLSTKMDSAPAKIKGNLWARANLRSQFGSGWNEFTDRMFSALMGTPTARLSRAPAFKQFYWRQVADLLPFTDAAVQQEVLLHASGSNLTRRTMRNLERATKSSGKLSMVELEDLAKGYALDDTKDLLYDISEKGQVSDILRNVVPFAEAWREVLGRWAKLTVKGGGKPIRRAQQLIQGARGSDFGEVVGAPKDKGFFYKNEFGEEVFAYPGSSWLMNQEFGIPGTPVQLPGMPVPLTGRVQGLNMFGSLLPSLGPVASIPTAWFLQDKPQYDWWREQLLPYGGPGAEESSDVFTMREYMPSWGKTAIDWLTEGGNDDRIYNSSVMYVAAYLHSTGDYGNSLDEQQRLMEDAKDKTRDIYAIRALGQFMLPSSPSPTWLIKDKDGHLLSQRILSEEFYSIVNQSSDYEQAVGLFLERYGTEAIGAIIPHSSAVIPNVPTTLEAAKWVAAHPDVKSSFPLTYGLFTPAGGDFHMQTYIKNFITEERDTLTPDQWQALQDNTLGNYWFNYQKDRLGADADSPGHDQAAWLRGVRKDILKSYPNWGNTTGIAEKPTIDNLITDLYRASKDDFLASTEQGKALKLYLTYRDKAMVQAEREDFAPNSFRTAKALAPTRQWLRAKAADIIDQYPAFKVMWDYVFDREFGSED